MEHTLFPAMSPCCPNIIPIRLSTSGLRRRRKFPVSRPWNLSLAFAMEVLIAGISSYLGMRKVIKIEPFDIFRG